MTRARYSLNENYFQDLNAEKAYWLGFIWADGCVYQRKNRPSKVFHLVQHNKDQYHLQDFLNCLKSTHPIADRKDSTCVITISNQKLIQDIESYGIHPRKSFDDEAIVCNIIADNRYDFVRGLLDGDGYVSRNGTVVKICANFKMAKWLKILFDTGSVWRAKDSRHYVWQINGRHQIQRFKTLVYNNTKPCLIRKYNRMFQL